MHHITLFISGLSVLDTSLPTQYPSVSYPYSDDCFQVIKSFAFQLGRNLLEGTLLNY